MEERYSQRYDSKQLVILMSLKEMPFFVRPAARKKIEKFAQKSGLTQMTVEIYKQAKQRFGS
jgi:hypothetical protein